MTDYNDGKWNGWNGGECPVHPETVVEFLTVSNGESYKWLARHVEWARGDNPVVAFRVIKEHKEPREFWLCLGEIFDSEDDARLKYGGGPKVIHVREVIE